jgi:hypothetical protein
MATEFFGPDSGIDTKDYLLMMDGTTAISRPEQLLGHTLTDANVDLSDALTVTRVRLKNGRIKTVVQTKRAPEERGRQYTVGFPSGALWTPAMELTLRTGCEKTFYMKYLCPDDRRYNHVEIMPDALLDPAVPEGDLITVDEESIITSTSTIRISEQFRLWAVGLQPIYDIGTAELHTIEFTTADCPSCTDVVGLGMITMGGDGIAVPEAELTDDRFATQTTLTTGGGAADYAVGLWTEGAIVLAGTSDAVTPAAGTAGSIFVSGDGGLNFGAVTGVVEPIWDFARLGENILAVGGVGGAAAKVYLSNNNGATWTAITSAALPATETIVSIDVDEETGNFYMVSEAGTFLKADISGSTVTIVDISANLAGTPTAAWRVKVLAKDHVAVGGADAGGSWYEETLDGGETFAEFATGAGASVIRAIAGTKFRTIVGAGTGLFIRDMLTNMEWNSVTLENGTSVTGNYTDGAEGVDGDFNQFCFCTDDGEVVFGKAFYPNA